VLAAGVAEHQVDQHADAQVAGRADQLHEVAQRPEPGIDRVVVGDVVPVVTERGRVERHQPQGRDPQPGQVVEPPGQPGQVADPVAVGVQERRHVGAVDEGVFPPKVAHGFVAHAGRVPQPGRP
jgi:hypothetical protein